MTRHTARVSRIGLVVIGLILLLGAGALLARGLNAFTVLGNPHAPLLTEGQAQYPTKNSWGWPVVAAGSFVIAVLAVWWMAAQSRIRAVRRVPLEPDRLPTYAAPSNSTRSPRCCACSSAARSTGTSRDNEFSVPASYSWSRAFRFVRTWMRIGPCGRFRMRAGLRNAGGTEYCSRCA
jgi:hypothetical protein